MALKTSLAQRYVLEEKLTPEQALEAEELAHAAREYALGKTASPASLTRRDPKAVGAVLKFLVDELEAAHDSRLPQLTAAECAEALEVVTAAQVEVIRVLFRTPLADAQDSMRRAADALGDFHEELESQGADPRRVGKTQKELTWELPGVKGGRAN